MHLGIGLLNECNPEFMWALACTENWKSSQMVNWNSLIDDYIDPLEVLENSNNVKANLSIFVENWWVDTV